MSLFESMLQDVNNALYSYILIILLVGVGIFFTVKTKFIQIRLIPEMFRVVTEKATVDSSGKKGVSSFQAFTISAASRIGTGNIAGVATAIALGGPGAIFWMWMIAIIGGASSLIESTLAQVYKIKDGNMYRGGPAYYMEKGLNKRWMGILFAVVITLTYGFVFNAVQANTITIAFEESFGSSRVVVGIILSIFTAVIVFGGLKRIVSVTQILVPVMALAYIAVALLVVFLNISELPNVFILIFKSAFGFEEAFAGMVGAAIMNGIKRGLFSNEAGMGSAPNAAASADVTHPVKQGLIQTLGVFTDTIVICSCTAFIILLYSDYASAGLEGIELTQAALSSQIGPIGNIFIAVCILLFAFSSIVGNYYYGESNIEFMSGNKVILNIFRVIVVCMVLFGSVAKVQLVWDLADVFMGIMAVINLVAIALLGKYAFIALKDYSDQKKAGIKDPVFDASNIKGLENVQCWLNNEKEENAI